MSELKLLDEPVAVSLFIHDEPPVYASALGERWNGFENPYFTREQGEMLAAQTERWVEMFGPEDADRVAWSPLHDAFMLQRLGVGYEQWELESIEFIDGVDVGGVQLFPIGGWLWTWQLVTLCETCMGTGRVAIGPWGSRPAKGPCPDCDGVYRLG